MSFKKSWLVFLVAALLFLPFSNGRWLTSWGGIFGPLFLLLFVRALPVKKGLIAGYAVLLGTSFIAWLTMNKVVSGPILFIGAAFAVIAIFLPYLADRFLRKQCDSKFQSTFYFPLALVSAEAVFSILIADIGSIAYSQFENLLLLQIASVLGSAGVAFLVAWFASTFSWFYELDCNFKRCSKGLAIFAAATASTLLFGYFRLQSLSFPTATLKVATVTSNEDHPIELVKSLRLTPNDPSILDSLSKRHEELFRKTNLAAAHGAQWVLWSEVLGSTIGSHHDRFIQSLSNLSRTDGIDLVAAIGLNSYDSPLTENKVLIFNKSGEQTLSYRKANLSPGENSVPGERKFAYLNTSFGRVGTAICADFNYSHFIRNAGLQNVDLVFDPAAEWPEIAKIQTAAVIFRAVENGFNVVKSTSQGDSFAADFTGKFWGFKSMSDNETLISDIPVRGTTTIYSKGGWIFQFVILILFLVTLCLKFYRWKRGLRLSTMPAK